MSLPLTQYHAVITDLIDMGTFYTGTCPCCHSFGLTIRRLRWANGRTEIEPFCPAGCSTAAIERAVECRSAVFAPLGIE